MIRLSTNSLRWHYTTPALETRASFPEYWVTQYLSSFFIQECIWVLKEYFPSIIIAWHRHRRNYWIWPCQVQHHHRSQFFSSNTSFSSSMVSTASTCCNCHRTDEFVSLATTNTSLPSCPFCGCAATMPPSFIKHWPVRCVGSPFYSRVCCCLFNV